MKLIQTCTSDGAPSDAPFIKISERLSLQALDMVFNSAHLHLCSILRLRMLIVYHPQRLVDDVVEQHFENTFFQMNKISQAARH